MFGTLIYHIIPSFILKCSCIHKLPTSAQLRSSQRHSSPTFRQTECPSLTWLWVLFVARPVDALYITHRRCRSCWLWLHLVDDITEYDLIRIKIWEPRRWLTTFSYWFLAVINIFVFADVFSYARTCFWERTSKERTRRETKKARRRTTGSSHYKNLFWTGFS